LRIALVVDLHTCPSSREEAHDSQPALPEANHHHVFARELHDYLNFSVARLNTANMIAMIQKRTMTRGSGQPFFSK